MRLIRSKKCIVFMIVLSILVLVIILLKYNGIIGNSSEMPEIVFVCDKYDLQGKPCEITFMDKYGKSYYSDDPYVCNILYGDLINAYKSGKLEGKIKPCGSCSRNEVIKRYRQVFRNAENIRMLPYLGYTNEQSLPRWDWEVLYFDESGEIQRVDLHADYPGYEAETNNKQANRIYEWCKEVMGKME